MNDNLRNFTGSTDSDSIQGRTNIEFENPRKPEKSIAYTSDEDAQAYFDAAIEAKSYPNRKVLIGEFLVAVQSYTNGEGTDDLAEVVEALTLSTVTISDE